MRIFLTVYCVIFTIGIATNSARAYSFWRADVPNAQKVAALRLAMAMLDALSVAVILFLWHNDLVTEYWLFMVGAPFVGICYFVLVGFERKWLTGKFFVPLDTPIKWKK